MADLPKIGIDIGTASIKIVELSPQGHDKWKLLSAAAVPMPGGGISDNPGSQSAIASAIVKMLKEAGVRSRKVVASLPEEMVSSHVVEMPAMSDTEVEQALQWQVEQYIPIPAEQAVWSYQIIRKDNDGGMEVLLAAVPKNLVQVYRSILDQSGLEVLALETELIATARAVVPDQSPLTLVVDIGAKSTDVGVVSSGQLVFSRTIPTAGQAFTRAIEIGLGLDTAQAEQYKNTYGFSDTMNGKLTAAMKPVLAVITAEVRKTIDFYLSKHGEDAVKVVTITGGIAALPDVVMAMSETLGLEVVVGNPFARVDLNPAQKKAIVGNGPFYAVAVGLAMRKL